MTDQQTEQPIVDAETEASERDERIQRANAQAARYRVERNEARQHVTDLQTQVAQLEESMRQQESVAQEERLARLRLAAVVDQGLPPELAGRLQGDDAEALVADAARLAALFPRHIATRTGNAAPTMPSRAQQIVNRIGGRDRSAFDMLLQRDAGGGVLVAPESE